MIETIPTIRKETRERIPLLLLAPAGLGLAFILVPILGLLWHIPWSGLWGYITNSTVLEALKISAIVSFSAAISSALVGLPLAYILSKDPVALTKFQIGGLSLIRAFVILPLVLPPVVGGVALLFALGRRGLIGEWLYKWLDISLPFTTVGAVIAATFVALPFFVISAETAFAGTDPKLTEAAKTLGAKRLAIFFRVIFPQILPGVIAGLALSWARAIGEFGATLTFAGNLQGRTQTLPLAMYEALESGRSDMALAISFLLLLIAASILILLRGHWFPFFSSRQSSVGQERTPKQTQKQASAMHSAPAGDLSDEFHT